MLIAVRRIHKEKGSFFKASGVYQEKTYKPDTKLPSHKLYRVLFEIGK